MQWNLSAMTQTKREIMGKKIFHASNNQKTAEANEQISNAIDFKSKKITRDRSFNTARRCKIIHIYAPN